MPAHKPKPKTARFQEQSTQTTPTNGEVLDLRSIVAQRDAKRARKQEKIIEEQQKAVQRKKKIKRKKEAVRMVTKKASTAASSARKKATAQLSADTEPPSHRALVASLGVFGLGLFLFLLPALVGLTVSGARSLETRVTNQATLGFEQLQAAAEYTEQLDASPARAAFQESQEAFGLAQSHIEPYDFLIPLAGVMPWRGDEVTAGWNLLQAGRELAAAGEQVTKAMEEFNATDVASIARDEDVGMTRLLLIAHATVAPTQQHVARAAEHLEDVDVEAVPADKRDLVAQVQELLPEVNTTLAESTEMLELLLAVLGNEREKRYAVIFANNHELRAGMGFPGAIAFVDVNQGAVTQIDIPSGGVYDVGNQLNEKIVSPKPLHLVNPHWSLQDSLWFPHFPDSARKFQWFLSESSAPSVDGVIALTPSVIEDLLGVTGPIDLQNKYGLVIDENNFYEEVQVIAEQKYDENPESKQIIADMTPILMNKLFSAGNDPEKLAGVVDVLSQALSQKEIVMYMNDEVLQRSVSNLDWGGELKQTDRDYLMVVQDNIAAGKTNGVIEDTIHHRADIAEDGSIVNTVTLTLNHTGDPEDPLAGVHYTGFVRFYVPEGSELIESSGFDTPDSKLFITPDDDTIIDEDLQRISGDVLVNELTQVYSNTEFGKHMFGGWIQVDAGEGASVTLKYRLPFTVAHQELLDPVDHYSLLVQKQLGSFGSVLQSEVSIPDNMTITRSYPDGDATSADALLEDDYFTGFIIERSS